MNTFTNKGVYIEPIFITRIEDKSGNVLETFIPDQHEAMSEETAYLMIDLMKGVVEFGTGMRLRFKYKFENPVQEKPEPPTIILMDGLWDLSTTYNRRMGWL